MESKPTERKGVRQRNLSLSKTKVHMRFIFGTVTHCLHLCECLVAHHLWMLFKSQQTSHCSRKGSLWSDPDPGENVLQGTKVHEFESSSSLLNRRDTVGLPTQIHNPPEWFLQKVKDNVLVSNTCPLRCRTSAGMKLRARACKLQMAGGALSLSVAVADDERRAEWPCIIRFDLFSGLSTPLNYWSRLLPQQKAFLPYFSKTIRDPLGGVRFEWKKRLEIVFSKCDSLVSAMRMGTRNIKNWEIFTELQLHFWQNDNLWCCLSFNESLIESRATLQLHRFVHDSWLRRTTHRDNLSLLAVGPVSKRVAL